MALIFNRMDRVISIRNSYSRIVSSAALFLYAFIIGTAMFLSVIDEKSLQLTETAKIVVTQ